MTDELAVLAEVIFTKNGKVTKGSAHGRLTIAGNIIAQLEQVLYTVEELINLGQLGSKAGYVLIENLDSTNYVEIRPASGGQDLIKISPGGLPALFELADNVTTTAVSNFTATPSDSNTIAFSDTTGLAIGDTLEITTADRRDFYTISALVSNTSIDVVGPALSEDITAIENVKGPYGIANTAACRIKITAFEI